jgi:uncharacterized protein (UPF0276 family)
VSRGISQVRPPPRWGAVTPAPAGASPPSTAVGLAYSELVSSFVRQSDAAVDYLEVPFELLRHDPAVFETCRGKPVVLHCASLSVAGSVGCPESLVQEIEGWIERTRTPWLGEHLSFVTASRAEAGEGAEPYAPGEPYNIGYTVSPPLSGPVVERVARNLAVYTTRFAVPLLVENPPLYFRVPGSTMTQAEFIGAVCARTAVGLLLDLAHLYITSRTMGVDVFDLLDRLPLERVEEIHVSGLSEQGRGVWDDHARRAPAVVHRMLARALERATPRAVTLEYNWSSRFPREVLARELARVRKVVARARKRNRDGHRRAH